MSEKRRRLAVGHAVVLAGVAIGALVVACDAPAPTELREAIEEVVGNGGGEGTDAGLANQPGESTLAKWFRFGRCSTRVRRRCPHRDSRGPPRSDRWNSGAVGFLRANPGHSCRQGPGGHRNLRRRGGQRGRQCLHARSASEVRLHFDRIIHYLGLGRGQRGGGFVVHPIILTNRRAGFLQRHARIVHHQPGRVRPLRNGPGRRLARGKRKRCQGRARTVGETTRFWPW